MKNLVKSRNEGKIDQPKLPDALVAQRDKKIYEYLLIFIMKLRIHGV